MQIIGITGLPGSGKSLASDFFVSKKFERVYFGGIVVEEVKRKGLEINEANERKVREELRQLHGMAAMALLSIPKIKELVEKEKNVVIDDLMSWQEFLVLKKEFPFVKILAVIASPSIRYARIAKRKERPLNQDACIARDRAELEQLQKGPTIAMADFTVVNETTRKDFEKQLEKILKNLK